MIWYRNAKNATAIEPMNSAVYPMYPQTESFGSVIALTSGLDATPKVSRATIAASPACDR